MDSSLYSALIVLLSSLTLGFGESGVSITNLSVPERVVNGSMDSVFLDCDYEIKGDSSGLVVKWFFNNSPDPVYQWIHRNRPQDLGILRGKLNLNYAASEDDLERHRALEIINPTVELSGDYKCHVSTFASEDSASKTMVIYVPERSLTLSKNGQDGKVTVRCVGEGIFPKPTLSITARDNDRAQAEESDVKVVPNNNVFDIYATVTYREEDLESPTTFDCLLRIPEANYSVGTSTVYMPEDKQRKINMRAPQYRLGPTIKATPQTRPERSLGSSRWSLSWSTVASCLIATVTAFRITY